jgi:hypothetical protein
MENNARAITVAEMGEQYSLARILGIWALAAIPMGILSWIIFPALSPDFDSDPLGAGVTRIVLLTFGLMRYLHLRISDLALPQYLDGHHRPLC